MNESLEEFPTQRDDNEQPICISCERTIPTDPYYCFVCQWPLCHQVCCSSGYAIPGFLQSKPLCPKCRKSWRYYYDLLSETEESARVRRVALITEWRNKQ